MLVVIDEVRDSVVLFGGELLDHLMAGGRWEIRLDLTLEACKCKRVLSEGRGRFV